MIVLLLARTTLKPFKMIRYIVYYIEVNSSIKAGICMVAQSQQIYFTFSFDALTYENKERN